MADQLDWTSTLNNPLDTLRNRIDISRVPFSDRGSRILLCQQDEQPRLTLRLAERLVDLHPGLETHRARADVFLVAALFIDLVIQASKGGESWQDQQER